MFRFWTFSRKRHLLFLFCLICLLQLCLSSASSSSLSVAVPLPFSPSYQLMQKSLSCSFCQKSHSFIDYVTGEYWRLMRCCTIQFFSYSIVIYHHLTVVFFLEATFFGALLIFPSRSRYSDEFLRFRKKRKVIMILANLPFISAEANVSVLDILSKKPFVYRSHGNCFRKKDRNQNIARRREINEMLYSSRSYRSFLFRAFS